MDYLQRSASVSKLQKISIIAIRSKMQAEQSILDNKKKRQRNGMTVHNFRMDYTPKISGHRTVGGKEEDQVTDFMTSKP